MLNEKLLQAFVGVVDTKLLERVLLKALKAEDVEQPDCISQSRIALSFLLPVFATWNGRVDFVNDPREESTVNAWKFKVKIEVKIVWENTYQRWCSLSNSCGQRYQETDGDKSKLGPLRYTLKYHSSTKILGEFWLTILVVKWPQKTCWRLTIKASLKMWFHKLIDFRYSAK